MSFNPFKKKTPEQPDAEQPAASTASADAPSTGAAPDSDRTDPLGDMHVAPASNVLRDGPGGRVEVVTNGDDRFLRLTVMDTPRADLLRPLLLDLPESSTGFRDLLVAEDGALAAAFDLPETNLKEVSGGQPEYPGATLVPPPDCRSIDVLDAIQSVASLLAAFAERGLVWQDPQPELIGLTSERAHRAEGYRRWRATFTAWDQLAPGDEALAARSLMQLFYDPMWALISQARAINFMAGYLPLAKLLGEPEVVCDSVDSYAEIAAFDFFSTKPTLYAATDTGRRREHNEDAYALLTLEQASVAGSRFALAAVADGMGGHNSGEVASSLALDLLRTQLSQLALSPRLKVAEPQLGLQLEQIVPAISRALNDRAAMDPGLGGMGTTLAGYVSLTPQSTVKGQALPSEQGAVLCFG
jgi:hypothetical protein